ncbi:hypothetical protein D9M69_620620 [compost metagenome]
MTVGLTELPEITVVLSLAYHFNVPAEQVPGKVTLSPTHILSSEISVGFEGVESFVRVSCKFFLHFASAVFMSLT